MGTVKGLRPLMWGIIIEAGDDFGQNPIAILGREVHVYPNVKVMARFCNGDVTMNILTQP